MKRIFLFAFLLVTLTGWAQKLDNALLWEISGNGLKHPSYLFGTIHATCDATLNENVKEALRATSSLYLEIDMDDPDLQSEMMKGMMMKNGTTMSSLVSEDDFKKLDTFLKEQIGTSAYALNTLKPFMVSSFLITKILDCPMQSVETELMRLVAMQNKQVYGLETVTEQLAVFDAIPYELQAKELMKTANSNLQKDKEDIKKMMDFYKNQDIEGMISFVNESEMYGRNDILLDNRNKNWIPKIEAIAKKSPTFFGVGAAHLAGENGVIKLLRKKGYTVEAVK